MALTVEDGTGLAAADSYISEADADTYFANHGSPSAWSAATSAQKESALRYATGWLDGKYAWVGELVSTTQALAWPRYDAEDREGRLLASNAVPQKVKDAACEAALLHLSNPLNATFARGGEVVRERLGSLEVQYRAGAPAEVQAPHIDRLLRLLTVGGSATTRVEVG